MKINWIFLGWVLCIFPATLSAQLLNETFDKVSAVDLNTSFFSNGDRIYFGISGTNPDFGSDDIPSGIKPYSKIYGNFLTGMRLNGLGHDLPIYISWENLDISGLTGIIFKADFAEYVDEPGHIDSHDFIYVEYQVDKGGYQKLLSFVGADFNTTNYNGVFREDTNFDGIGDGVALNEEMQRFMKDIPELGEILDLRIAFSVNAYEEDFALDNVILLANEVSDVTAPQFLPQQNFQVYNMYNSCGAYFEFDDPIAIDETDDFNIDVYQVQGIASGELFPVGITEVIYEAKDSSGNSNQIKFYVEVIDLQAPVMFCKQNLVFTANEGECGVQISYETPWAIDNCSNTEDIEIIQIGGLGSGTYFEVGTHYETFLAIDEADNIAACSIEIEVLPSLFPKLNCGDSLIEYEVSKGEYFILPELDYDITGSCDTLELSVKQYPEAGARLRAGKHIIKIELYNDAKLIDVCETSIQITERVINVVGSNTESFVIYPNPTNGILYSDIEEGYKEILLYDNLGRLLKRYKSFPINIESLPSGRYYLELKHEIQTYTFPVLKRY